MSKILTTFIISAVVIAAIVLVFIKKPAANQPIVENTGEQAQTNETAGETPTQSEGKKMAFDVFLKQGLQGQAYECTVHQYVGEIDTVGKVWIDGDKLHGEFATSTQGQNITSKMTVLDGYTYAWTSMSNTGFKMKNATSNLSVDTNGNTSGSYSWNASQIGDYDCKAWTPAESTFALPANIKFTEMKAS